MFVFRIGVGVVLIFTFTVRFRLDGFFVYFEFFMVEEFFGV